MIPEAREVHLSKKYRKMLEACCHSPVTLQRDLKRAPIVLLAAAGRSTRSIAKEAIFRRAPKPTFRRGGIITRRRRKNIAGSIAASACRTTGNG
jgi:hypothetical protein